ncbi:ABC transporter ATP-binding protein [Thalassotalea sp. LPB0316]|uniref:ABC transporter ATP-binding protein n=1 Tax=Thalassotalea sp. LPB0316 TaxID=2769490 RepID=UPI0018672618|nr:ABC transporter ATP-binding protein [Thalassotalea sp. LPB0316]QOL25085.1 ABC transporter ATP-binding protein [Thalassotalea sp. LPB0316]
MLHVSKLTRSYGDFVAVNNVSFSIQQGEIIGLLGHNGAGKTSIMKIISGFLEAEQGEVTLDGISITNEPKKLQQQLGYLPENLPVYPEMTIAEYLDYAADLKGLKGEYKHSEIKRVIQATDLSAKLLAPIETLSRGYKQRVGVAQAILGQPKLLILDEPTNGLDPEQTQQMRELIKSIASQATVILSTHIMQEVDALCDRVLILKNGQLLLDETMANLQDTKHVLVETDFEQLDLIEALIGVEFVAPIDSQKLLVELEQASRIREISSEISRLIVNHGKQLYSLVPRKRDLESVFNQINNQEPSQEVTHKEVQDAA